MTNLIEKYLGDQGPEAFESEQEARSYFSEKNLVWMFGPDQYDEHEAAEALQAVLTAMRG